MCVCVCVCGLRHICVAEATLTSREGVWEDPGGSLRRSEDRRRLRLLTEDSERSHSLPREAELCHHRRVLSPGCQLQPPRAALPGTLPTSSPSPGLRVLKCVDPPLAGYLGGSGSRALPGVQKAVQGAAAGCGRQVDRQLR